MSNEQTIIDNTFSGYLGPEFQNKLMWQLLVEPSFAEKIIPDLSIDYFDEPTLKKLFIIISNYLTEFEKPPNLQNQSIYHAISLYKKPKSEIEEETLYSLVRRIKLYNERVINKETPYDGDVIQKSTHIFIKQQEYRKFGEYVLSLTKSGKIKDKQIIGDLEDKIRKINEIGEDEDFGTEVTEGIDDVLKPNFRETIPTGIGVLDAVTGGGLGKGEIGLILSPSGVGKTTILSKIANTAYELGKNILQIVFEDDVFAIKRKHYTLWSGIPLTEIDDNLEEVKERVIDKIESIKKGRLLIKRYTKDDVTIPDIKSFILRYQKKFGIKFDIIILDYLDCLESHKKTKDRTEDEFTIVKSFLNLSGELDIPCWSATQGNRESFGSEVVNAIHQGGSIKRIQKAHFVMSIAKTDSMKEAHRANIKIIKARFAQDGQMFHDCEFNNDTMSIIIRDERFVKLAEKPKDTDDELDRLKKKIDNIGKNDDDGFFIKEDEEEEMIVEKTFELSPNESFIDAGGVDDSFEKKEDKNEVISAESEGRKKRGRPRGSNKKNGDELGIEKSVESSSVIKDETGDKKKRGRPKGSKNKKNGETTDNI